MRGRINRVKSIVPTRQLHDALQDILCHYFGKQLALEKLERRVSEYCSSFIIEELDATLSDGATLALIFKDLSPTALLTSAGRVKPRFLYNPLREIDTYRKVLVLHQLGTAVCYGALVEPEQHRYWLFLERMPPVHLWQMGEAEVWQNVARWLAGMHSFLVRETEVKESQHLAHLVQYDRKYYQRWMNRAKRFVRAGDKSADRAAAGSITWLSERYQPVIDRLSAMPRTVIHGEYFASNVLLDDRSGQLRVCPIDWEMAAVGPGAIDLAGLTSGNWTQSQKDAMAMAYYEALPREAAGRLNPEEFLTSLEFCRLHQAVQWLGWSPAWTPPPEHAQNWLKEALRSAEILKL